MTTQKILIRRLHPAAATLFGQSYKQIQRNIVVNLRTVMVGAIYKKTLRPSGEAEKTFTQGRILNMINVDVEGIIRFADDAVSIPLTPVQVAVGVTLLHRLIDNAVFASLVVIVLTVSLQGLVLKSLASIQKKLYGASDARLKAIRELLYGVRAVKLHAWEPIFHRRIEGLRENQLAHLKSYNIVFMLSNSMGNVGPMLMPVVGLLFQYMDPAVVFPALSLYEILFLPFVSLAPFSLASVSISRIRAFLFAAESNPLKTLPAENPSDADAAAIAINGASFKWESVVPDGAGPKGGGDAKEGSGDKKASIGAAKGSKPSLRWPKPLGGGNARAEKDAADVDGGDAGADAAGPFFENLTLRIPRGKLTCVVGPVGSGKSSLLSAIIGEMAPVAAATTTPPTPPPVEIRGRMAYAPQQPWIVTDTVEGNIAFAGGRPELAGLGQAEREARMDAVIEAAMLKADLAALSAGRKTLIGEKGVNLSGGQQARLSLARAVYDDADIYLLDFPLSALDARVGTAGFSRRIKRALASKTVVLVTHQLHFLPFADHIVVMQKGRVVEEGKFEALVAKPDGALSGMMAGYGVHDGKDKGKASGASQSGVLGKEAALAGGTHDGQDMEKEIGEDGDDGDEEATGAVGQDDNIIKEEERETGTISKKVWLSFFRAVGGWPLVATILTASAVNQAVGVVTSQSLTWWTDGKFNDSLGLAGYTKVYAGLTAATILGLFTVSFLAVAGGYTASKHYHKAAISRLMYAPMSFFESQPIGRILNRLSRDVDFIDQYLYLFYFSTMFYVLQLIAPLILLVIYFPILLAIIVPIMGVYYVIGLFYRTTKRELRRLESNYQTLAGLPTIRAFQAEDRFVARQRVLAACITLTISLLGISGKVSPSSIGLTLTTALSIIDIVGGLVKNYAMLESEMNSVERLEYYCTEIPNEAARALPTDPDQSWPSAGEMVLSGLEVRYPSRPDHAVLKNISINVRAGEKIGVVGRTGSGKTTLLSAVFRLTEPTSGVISIDGRPTTELGLATLRSRLQIITQDPILFAGTVRFNLDIEERCTDAEIWAALDAAGLKDAVAEMPGKLDAMVEEGGSNLSVGQRQLMCLCRAILKKRAAAGAAIRAHFADATVVSVAHRLHTVAGFDRVLVLDGGRVAEFDAPAALLDKPKDAEGAGGVFRSMAEATGKENFEALRDAARKGYRVKE
ncbi:P-loop containing nucleoside triphosphate hydrolase protein [Zopfochytrium polystomum]|nr:P-loop containing nucleoside triphosphate hydrolase protein [Zopfochytrium polystomum]